MRIEHLAIWVDSLEIMRQFYLTYFEVSCSPEYHNPSKNYTSCFLTFQENGCRIELMCRPGIADNTGKRGLRKGIAHFAVSVGDIEGVDNLTERLRKDGYLVESGPRTTGDGYYESVVLDPEGNYVEITV